MKKSAILAAAVASLMVGAVQADTTMYGKARIFLELGTEKAAPGGVDDRIQVSSYSSRIGWKGSEDLGNGMSAVYQFEVAYNADGDNTAAPFSTRVGYGGIKGDFGQVAIGQQWTPSYVLVRGKHDPMNTTAGGNVYGGGFPAATRVGNTISYINSFGDVKLAVAIVSANSDTLNDAIDAAISIPAGPVTVGVALAQQDAAGTTSPTALDLGWASGALSANLGLFMTDVNGADDWMSVVVKFKTDGGQITAQLEDNGTDNQINAAYTHKLSKKTSIMAEISSGDVAADETNVGIHINF